MQYTAYITSPHLINSSFWSFTGSSDGASLVWLPWCDSHSKESTCIVGDPSLIPGLGRSPGEGHGDTLQYSCLENPHGQRSLVDYRLWGRKKSDMTEQLSTQHTDGKESPCDAGDPCLIPGSGRFPWRRKWLPTPVVLPGEFHGQRSLSDFSPGHDWMTFTLIFHTVLSLYFILFNINLFILIGG